MANVFDQFDEQQQGNVFDQFDATPEVQQQTINQPIMQPTQETDYARAVARPLRATAVGMASPLDLLQLATTRPLGEAVAYGAETLGYPETAQTIRQSVRTPISATVENIIDENTASQLKPQNMAERYLDTLAQFGGGAGAINVLAKGSKMLQPLTTRTKQDITALTGGALGTQAAAEADLGAAGQIAGGLLGGIAGAKLGQPKMDFPKTSQAVKELSSGLYKQAEDLGGILTEDVANKFVGKMQDLKPKPIAGKVVTSEDKKLINAIDEFSELANTKLTLDDAQRIDEALGTKIDSLLDAGRVTKEAKKFIDLQDSFRDIIDNVAEKDIIGGKQGFDAWKQAKSTWSQYIKARDIENIIEKAELTDNPVTSIKTGFRNLYTNPKRIRGYTSQEKALIKKASQTGIATEVLRTLGGRLIPQIAAATGGAFGGVPTGLGAGVASQGLTTASRNLASKMQKNRAEKALQEVLSRGYNAQALEPSLSQTLLNPIKRTK